MRSRRPSEIESVIDAVDHEGFGEATYGEQGKRRVRIKNALPGEAVSARVLKRRKGVWLAEAFEVASDSTSRVVPGCGYFPRCGGCAMQHLDYERQISLKEDYLLAELSRQGVVAERVNPATLGPRFNYRTKARFGVRVVGGEVLVGFRETFSNRVARMDACLTLTQSLAALPGSLKTLIGTLSCPERIPQVEVAAGDEGAAIILRHLEQLTTGDIEHIESFSQAQGVRVYGQSAGYDSVVALSANAAEGFLSYGNTDFGIHFRFRPMDFTQVNMDMNRKLVRAAVAALVPHSAGVVLDLFAGIGNFSLALAARGLRVHGLEASAESIDRARMNARHNALEARCEFEVRDLYHADCLDLGRAASMVLDPPRSGAGPNLDSWTRSSGVERIAYVSCSPVSFAADAATLVKAGFDLIEVGIFDMFPHTAHVETLGIFHKRW
jgi:23S rRNA (uracil1939-C5)-methyltransferase